MNERPVKPFGPKDSCGFYYWPVIKSNERPIKQKATAKISPTQGQRPMIVLILYCTSYDSVDFITGQ